MPPDKNTILENAQLYASRGQYDKAIAEWKKLAAGPPADGTVHNTIGDLHLKRNAPADAIEAYLAAAEAFRAAGAPLKAIAVYKKILKVDPARHLIYKHLGDLNAERGLVSNAIADYLVLAKGCLKDGRVGDAIAVYRTIVRLDSSQVEVRQRLAALCLQENQRDEAVEAYVELGRECLAQGRPEEAQEACQAALRIEPAHQPAHQLLRTLGGETAERESPQPVSETESAPRPSEPGGTSRHGSLSRALRLMDQRQYDAAECVLTEMLSAEPGDPEICRLLASLHLRRGLLTVAQSEFKFLAESAMRAQDYPLAESMIREYLEADQDCVVFTELLGQLLEQTGEPVAAAAQYGKALALLLAHPDPDYPTFPLELYGKIVLLDPASPLVARYARAFEPAPGREAAGAVARPEEPAPGGKPAGESVGEEDRPFQAELRLAEPGEVVASAQTVPDEPVGPRGEDGEALPAAGSRPAHEAFRFAGGTEDKASEETGVLPASAGEAFQQPCLAYEAHLELGLAYRCLGLPNEAIEELRIAVEGPGTFVEATLELVRCWREQGDAPAAIAHLERARCDPRCEGEPGAPLYYELACLYDLEGQVDRAIELYSAVPTFKDAAARLDRLEQTRPVPQPVPGGEPAAAQAGSGSERKKRRISYL